MNPYSIRNIPMHDLLQERQIVASEIKELSPKAVADSAFRGHLEALRMRDDRIGQEIYRRNFGESK